MKTFINFLYIGLGVLFGFFLCAFLDLYFVRKTEVEQHHLLASDKVKVLARPMEARLLFIDRIEDFPLFMVSDDQNYIPVSLVKEDDKWVITFKKSR